MLVPEREGSALAGSRIVHRAFVAPEDTVLVLVVDQTQSTVDDAQESAPELRPVDSQESRQSLALVLLDVDIALTATAVPASAAREAQPTAVPGRVV